MSKIYISSIVILVVNILPLFGLAITSDKAYAITQAIFTLASGALILYARYKQGDITAFGLRK